MNNVSGSILVLSRANASVQVVLPTLTSIAGDLLVGGASCSGQMNLSLPARLWLGGSVRLNLATPFCTVGSLSLSQLASAGVSVQATGPGRMGFLDLRGASSSTVVLNISSRLGNATMAFTSIQQLNIFTSAQCAGAISFDASSVGRLVLRLAGSGSLRASLSTLDSLSLSPSSTTTAVRVNGGLWNRTCNSCPCPPFPCPRPTVAPPGPTTALPSTTPQSEMIVNSTPTPMAALAGGIVAVIVLVLFVAGMLSRRRTQGEQVSTTAAPFHPLACPPSYLPTIMPAHHLACAWRDHQVGPALEPMDLKALARLAELPSLSVLHYAIIQVWLAALVVHRVADAGRMISLCCSGRWKTWILRRDISWFAPPLPPPIV